MSTSGVTIAISPDDEGAGMEARILGTLTVTGGYLTLTTGRTVSLVVIPDESKISETPLAIQVFGATYVIGDQVNGGGGLGTANGDTDLLHLLSTIGLPADAPIMYWQS